MRKGESTRARIVARAAELFNTHGYDGTSIADVMAAAAIEKGGLYRHFSSKEELAVAAFGYATEQVGERMRPVFQTQGHAADTLLDFIDVLAEYYANPPLVGGCPILNTAIDSDDANPTLRGCVQKSLAAWSDSLQRVMLEGLRRGEIQAGVDTAEVALLLIGTMEGALMLSRILDDPGPLRIARAHLCDYINSQIRSPALE